MEWQTKQIRRTYNRLGLGMLAYLLIYQFLSLPLMLVVKLLCPQLLSLLGMLYLLGAAYVGYTLWRCRGRHPLQNDPKLPEGALDAALLNVGMLLFTAASFAMAGYVILYL